MEKPDIPLNEESRLKCLNELHILDTPPEERFDRITRLAQRLFDVPIALVSLVDRDRQWFKSSVGLAVRETSREISFCGHTILGEQALTIPDTARDSRFSDNPLVLDVPHIRFYAGYPLRASDGSKLGTLCIIDCKPRHLSPEELSVLEDLAGIAERELVFVQSLKVREERLSGILNNTEEAIISTDEREIIQIFNRGSTHIFGYTPEEAIGQPISIIFSRDCRDTIHHHIRSLEKSNEIARSISEKNGVYGRRKNGETFPLGLSISQSTSNGSKAYTYILRDLTERYAVNRMQNEFISMVSHELRSPLTSVYGSLKLLSTGKLCNLHEEGKLLLEIAIKNTERLTRLINDILDLEQIASGKLRLNKRLCNVAELGNQAVELIQPLADTHDIVLSSSLVSATLYIDPDRILQILINLLDNAIKFSSADSTVSLTVEDRDDEVVFKISDRGRGIPADKLDSIFERFQRVDVSDSRQKGGTGLGLAICREIIELHQGRISVDSQLGKGSTFTFVLPKGEPKVEPTSTSL